MKRMILTIMMLAGLISMSTQADVPVSINGNQMDNGYMNVFFLDGSTFAFGSGWGVADLSATFNEAGDELTMVPNSIGDPSEYWYIGGGAPGAPGNKIMEAAVYNEVTGILNGSNVVFSGVVVSNTITSNHAVTAFIRDFAPDYSSRVETSIPITNSAPFSIELATIPDPTRHIQYGIQMRGVNVWVTDLAPFGSVVIEAIEDTSPPIPSPMAFEVLPTALNDSTISMTATNTFDTSGVEYYFTCTTFIDGSHDSGWQSSPTYVDTGLSPGTEYTYTVTARDLSTNQNETAASAPASISTSSEDTTPPSPATMTFATEPLAISPVSIAMTATTATDSSGVEYYFDCTSVAGNDSGWQSSPTYIDTGLTPNTLYTYTVIARDLSTAKNSNTVSVAKSATTAPVLLTWMTNSLTSYSGDATQLSTLADLGADSLECAVTTSTNKTITFDGAGATFGLNAADDAGRNILRTVASDYSATSFEAYATIELADGRNAFIGFGQGLDGAYGVPDLSLAGVSSVFAEFTTALTKIWSQYDGAPGDENLQNVATSAGTHRMKLAYDAGAQTATVTVLLDYFDGAFSDELMIGTVSTTNLTSGAPVRVFVGGDDGLVVTDLVIVGSDAPVVGVDDLAIAATGGEAVLSWTSVSGQTYDLVYKTDLTAASWAPDVSGIPGTGGGISVTSTVSAAEAFYSVTTE